MVNESDKFTLFAFLQYNTKLLSYRHKNVMTSRYLSAGQPESYRQDFVLYGDLSACPFVSH